MYICIYTCVYIRGTCIYTWHLYICVYIHGTCVGSIIGVRVDTAPVQFTLLPLAVVGVTIFEVVEPLAVDEIGAEGAHVTVAVGVGVCAKPVLFVAEPLAVVHRLIRMFHSALFTCIFI